MLRLLGMLFGMKDVKFRHDDDFIDRLTRRHTTILLMLFSVVVTAKQYVGEPIRCWCPAHFTDSHKAYANTICWVKNTYYVPFEDQIPKITAPREELTYYQWLPLILVVQALLCYFPSLIWRFICRRSGLNVAAVMDAAISGQRTSYADIREKTVRYMVNTVDKYLMARSSGRANCCGRFKQSAAKHCCFVYGKMYGNYLTCGYIFTKLLYVANAIGQLFLLDIFMGEGFHFYGVEVINRFINRDDWTRSIRFPRVTLCDFQIRHQTQLHRYIVQCVLPINLFSEKIYIFIWFWFALLCVGTVLSFLKWTYSLTFWPQHVGYIKRLMSAYTGLGDRAEKGLANRFVSKYLKRDGIFIIRLISNNVGCITSAEVLSGLWDNYVPDTRLMATSHTNSRGNESPTRSTALRLNALVEKLEDV